MLSLSVMIGLTQFSCVCGFSDVLMKGSAVEGLPAIICAFIACM